MTLFPVPAFSDNYIWVLHDGQRALAVDPGESEGLLAWLTKHRLQLDTILLTHHHGDHTGGVDELRIATGARVVGPTEEALPDGAARVGDGDKVTALGMAFDVLKVPGHTAGHIAFYSPDAGGSPVLFCGDTLFSGGCGRLFEGTPAQMLGSLTRLAGLPDETRVCCAHEYTLSNLRFARAVDPDNPELSSYTARCEEQRADGLPTLPSSIGLEKQVNPFLRAHLPALERAARSHDPDTPEGNLGVFTTLRAWKNVFQ